MGRATVIFEPEVEAELRARIGKRGDLSRIVNEALKRYFEEEQTPNQKVIK